MKGKFYRTAAAATAAVLLFCGSVGAAPSVSAGSAILTDESGLVLFEKNADERSLIASTTKIMTALLVCEDGDLAHVVRVPAEAAGVEGSSMYLKAGERLTVRELLNGLMLSSGNDAAIALAIASAGSAEKFVRRMNERAERLGLANTHFANPNGLDDPENYSTARELAALAACAMRNETFREIVSQRSAKAAGRTLTNHNRLLWLYEGADGVKTGYTLAAGRILVSSAVRRGRRLVAVTIRDRDDWNDHAALLDYGFGLLEDKELLPAGQVVGQIPVVSGGKATVKLKIREPLRLSLFPGEQPELRLCAPRFAYAPAVSGEAAGYLEILSDGTVLARQTVYYGETVARAAAAKKSLWQRIWGG